MVAFGPTKTGKNSIGLANKATQLQKSPHLWAEVTTRLSFNGKEKCRARACDCQLLTTIKHYPHVLTALCSILNLLIANSCCRFRMPGQSFGFCLFDRELF